MAEDCGGLNFCTVHFILDSGARLDRLGFNRYSEKRDLLFGRTSLTECVHEWRPLSGILCLFLYTLVSTHTYRQANVRSPCEALPPAAGLHEAQWRAAPAAKSPTENVLRECTALFSSFCFSSPCLVLKGISGCRTTVSQDKWPPRSSTQPARQSSSWGCSATKQHCGKIVWSRESLLC